jgi:hypothetical protein
MCFAVASPTGIATHGWESKFFYFDDALARRLRPNILTSEHALEQAKGASDGHARQGAARNTTPPRPNMMVGRR